MNKFKIAILRNESDEDHLLWEKACLNFADKIDYVVIDLTKADWLEKCQNEKYHYYLLRPPNLTSLLKQLYDERVYILSETLNLAIYPSMNEILIYENKRFLYSWLKANKLPHPKTHIFYDKKDAMDFIHSSRFPIVAKHNTGASGSGVKILRNKSASNEYIEKLFSDRGTRRRWGPNLEQSGLLKRGFNYLKNPNQIKSKLKMYEVRRTDIQRGFVIFQEYVNHEFEWRIVGIGGSYFAHKKIKIGEKASGSLLKSYDTPPLYLFDFAKSILDKYNFYSQAIDVFEGKNGDLLINEMQCMFGQSDPYQMLVDAKPGRYMHNGENWSFEEGNFNNNECFDLRVRHVLSILNKTK